MSLYLMQRYPDRKFWINDLDPFVSNFWSVLASAPDELAKTLNQYLNAESNSVKKAQRTCHQP